MKLLLALLLSVSAFATIPTGKYQVEKIQCKTGKVMKLGGKFMIYTIYLNVSDTKMKMTAKAKAGSWAPFKLDCTQINEGEYVHTSEGKYEGELPNISTKCNNARWTKILKKKLFGVEEYGEFNYTVNGNKLVIFNPNTITKYSCDKAGDYPIYYYKKI
ncbi:MAG: hypothetical protein N4A33_01665 [Bacteriovoracaceae bacterium]|jgi:hypothetical protein|nr:hypothetical protein [Bacteriovoracaceae bacterium]